MKKEDFIDLKNGIRIRRDKIKAWLPYHYKDKDNKYWVIHFEVCDEYGWQSKEFGTRAEAEKWAEKVIYEEGKIEKEDFIILKDGIRIRKDKIVVWYPHEYKDDKNNKYWIIHFEICDGYGWQSQEFKTKEEAEKWVESILYKKEKD